MENLNICPSSLTIEQLLIREIASGIAGEKLVGHSDPLAFAGKNRVKLFF